MNIRLPKLFLACLGIALFLPSAASAISVRPEEFGADPSGSVDSSAAFNYATEAAAIGARKLNDRNGHNTAMARGVVVLSAGATYLLNRPVIGSPFVDYITENGGRAILTTTRNRAKALTWDFAPNNRVEGIEFVRFGTAIEFDTNNVSGSTFTVENVYFLECELGIDSKSYPKSRSTVLNIINVRAAKTKQLVKSFTDQLNITRSFIRNGSNRKAMIEADSNVSIRDSMFVPYNFGARARWIDLHASDKTRHFLSSGVRWSGEGGGIPVIFNYADGGLYAQPPSQHDNPRKNEPNRLNLMISFVGGSIYASNARTKKAAVVLMNNRYGGSHAPNAISFRHVGGQHVKGWVVTESGKPPILDPERFRISIDDTGYLVTMGGQFPLVEERLVPYVSQ